jgi:hypothetical protein
MTRRGYFRLNRRLAFWLSVVCISIAAAPVSPTFVSAQAPADCTGDGVLIIGQVDEEDWGIVRSEHANKTVYWENTQSNPNVLGFSRARGGPFTTTLSVPVTLDSNGVGWTKIYVKGVGGGQSRRTTCLTGLDPNPICTWVENFTVKGCAACPAIPTKP